MTALAVVQRPGDRHARPTCNEPNDVFGLRCIRERGHDGYHIHDDGNAVAAWAPDASPAPR